jgi:regulator of sigma E protease
MSPPFSILATVVLIAVLITVHELGHFLVAKACGVRVKVFSVGFGPRLFGFRAGDTDYRVSALPLGGYVRMAGSDPFGDAGQEDDDDPQAPGAFLAASAWRRVLIVAAGPVMNLILPFLVFTVVLMHGERQPLAVVGDVTPGSAAAEAGVRADDQIVGVDGQAVRTWNDVDDEVGDEPAPLRLSLRGVDGATREVSLPAPKSLAGSTLTPLDHGISMFAPGTDLVVDDPSSPAGVSGLRSGDTLLRLDGDAVRDWHDVVRLASRASSAGKTEIAVAWRPAGSDEASAPNEGVLRVNAAWAPERSAADDDVWAAWGLACADTAAGGFTEDSAGKAAGLEEGDRLLAVDGGPVRVWPDITRLVGAAASGSGETMSARPVAILVRRDGVLRTFQVTPKVVRDTDFMARYRWRAMIGMAAMGAYAEPEMISRPYPLAEAFPRAVRETGAVASGTIQHIGRMITNQVDTRKSVGGIVEIARQSKAAAERGLLAWARLLGLISISLGVANLLPVPVLDGGQLLMYLAEWVRGRPLPLAVRERLQQVGVIVLVGLMLFTLVNDLLGPARP